MKNKQNFTRLLSLSVLIAMFSLTGCGDGNDKSTSDDSVDNEPVTDSEVPVQKRSTNLGEVYTDKEGMTLYTFNKDTANTSNCNDACASNWPPLMATDEAIAKGRFSIITRQDGSKQWALDQRPLYRWINDKTAGDTTGEEVKSLWYVAQTAPISKRNVSVTTEGVSNTVTVLTDTKGKTLYIFTNDEKTPKGSSCNGACATKWPPLLATDDDKANGAFSIIERDDKSKQWAYHNMPLYRFAADSLAGDTSGENVKTKWYVAEAVPASKFNTLTQGVVISDTNWKSLYVLDNETSENLLCKGGCLTAWPPLIADDKDMARGKFTSFTNANGKKQWAYNNKPLYRWKGDLVAGDLNGQGLAHPSGATWIAAKP